MDMKRKLRSEKGASITFALLLFLVCAMVSSVVIVAATSASGRMSNLADIDRRYYAVSSAAELLGATLNGKSVKVVEEQTQTTTTTYGPDGGVVGTPDKKYAPNDPNILLYDGEDGITSVVQNYSILTNAVNKLTTGDQLFKDNAPSAITFPNDEKLKLEARGTGVSADPSVLSVNIYEELAKDGTLTFYISKPLNGSDDGAATLGYTMRMIFEPERTEDIVSHVDHGSPVLTGTDGSYTITDRETITKTIVYKWTLINVKKSTVPSKFRTVSG